MQINNPLDDATKGVIWKRWEAGKPMSYIGRTVNKPPATVFSYLRYHGGIWPRARHRSLLSLSPREREEISRRLAANLSLRSIAEALGRSPSTISREVKRNGGVGRYRATVADQAAWNRSKQPKPYALATNVRLKALVTRKLTEDWSPEQIGGWLRFTYPHDERPRVSHETIYKSLFIQTRGRFKKQLRSHLRTKRKFRHLKTHRAGSRGQIVNGIPIRDRPADIEDRAVPGHWEGDLIRGANSSHIATVVERQSRFTILVRVKSKSTEEVVSALSAQISQLPKLLQQSLAWDRGTEFAAHAKFTIDTAMDVYFCDPSSPWQRGTNENTNGLLRQYFPKGQPMAQYTQRDLNRVAAKLNARRNRPTQDVLSTASNAPYCWSPT